MVHIGLTFEGLRIMQSMYNMLCFHFADVIFKCNFFNQSDWILNNILIKVFLCLFDNKLTLVKATSHHLNQCWPRSIYRYRFPTFPTDTKCTQTHVLKSPSGLNLGLHPANERRCYKCNDVSHWQGASLESSLLHPANERRRYKVMASLIGWAQT